MAPGLFRHPQGRLRCRAPELPVFLRGDSVLPGAGGCGGAGLRPGVHRADGPHRRDAAPGADALLCGPGRPCLRRGLLAPGGLLLLRAAAGGPHPGGRGRHLFFLRHHRLPQGHPPQPPGPGQRLPDGAEPPRPDPEGRLSLHPAPLPHQILQRCTGSAASFPAAGRCCCGG